MDVKVWPRGSKEAIAYTLREGSWIYGWGRKEMGMHQGQFLFGVVWGLDSMTRWDPLNPVWSLGICIGPWFVKYLIPAHQIDFPSSTVSAKH